MTWRLPYPQHGSLSCWATASEEARAFTGTACTIACFPKSCSCARYEERYGRKFIPENMTIQDFGVSYAELEPYFTQFEYVCGTSGKAGNLQGKVVPGGNPLEGARSKGISAGAVAQHPGRAAVRKSRARGRLSSLSGTRRQRVAALHQSLWRSSRPL